MNTKQNTQSDAILNAIAYLQKKNALSKLTKRVNVIGDWPEVDSLLIRAVLRRESFNLKK